MKSSGNGSPAQCVANLLQTIRGEVPFERLKGIAPSVFDTPSAEAAASVREAVTWLLRTYEPRFELKSADIPALAAEYGAFELRIES
jgi:phage baseplate assembly protein W